MHEIKDVIDRPRPAGRAGRRGGLLLPERPRRLLGRLRLARGRRSTLRLRPSWSGGTALLIGGVALTALIGLSRVYLGVHYLSDVTGGWGLGVSAFALMTVLVS